MTWLRRLVVVVSAAATLASGCGLVDTSPDSILSRDKRQVGSAADERCAAGEQPPPARVNTSERLLMLRTELKMVRLDAFLVPSGDNHQSEYIAPADKRRQWIGGFSGSSGFAVVTWDKAAMWTDGRYFIQASQELDCNWLFMRGSEHDDATWMKWLAGELKQGANVGADPRLTGAFTWLQWEKSLREMGLNLVPVRWNPIDQVWADRPSHSREPLAIHDVRFAGATWQDKVKAIRSGLEKSGNDAIVITALDEVAWLLNLRGNDIPFTPVFRAYLVMATDEAGPTMLYIPPEKQSQEVIEHLNSKGCSSGPCVEVRDYVDVFDDLPGLLDENGWTNVLLGKKRAYSGGASYAVYRAIPADKWDFQLSPVMLAKASKSRKEANGMKAANVRDAVALIEFASEIESGMKNGERWDELKASRRVEELRSRQKHNVGLSFETISAYGSNGAIIHYTASNVSNAKIGTDSTFLFDSGGQYLDGTTDVTRTFHYGEPTSLQREAYTRVLAGSIDLARAVFIDGTPDTRLDVLARSSLWRAGMNYNHGTGHGIGAYGFIHESPVQVRVYAKEEHPMREGYFFSDEPGYYEAGEFGIRLETVLATVKKPDLAHARKDESSGGGNTFLGFEPVCLVPFEPNLIDYTLLNQDHVDWLNSYNSIVRDRVGRELAKQRKSSRVVSWMMSRTEPITQEFLRVKRQAKASNGVGGSSSASSALLVAATAISILKELIYRC